MSTTISGVNSSVITFLGPQLDFFGSVGDISVESPLIYGYICCMRTILFHRVLSSGLSFFAACYYVHLT